MSETEYSVSVRVYWGSVQTISMRIGAVLVVGSGGRGRYPSARVGFRNDSFRGRGNFVGGRGYNRSEFRSQGEFPSRPRASGGRSVETYQRVDQSGRGRFNRQGANAGSTQEFEQQ